MEFKCAINPITVEFCASSLILPPPPLLSPPQFTHNHAQKPSCDPLPSVEGCELNHNATAPSQVRISLSHPSPFQRDVGCFNSLDAGTGEGERQGGTQEVGGPGGTSPKQTMTLVVVCFLPSLSPQPIDLKPTTTAMVASS